MATELGQVFHYGLFGRREVKYDFLFDNNLISVHYVVLKKSDPNYFFVEKKFNTQDAYEINFYIPTLFPLNSLVVLTKRDDLSVDFDSAGLEKKIDYFLDKEKTVEQVCKHFGLVVKDNDKWDAIQTRKNVLPTELKSFIKDFEYRLFDNRKLFYNSNFVARPNIKVLGNFI